MAAPIMLVNFLLGFLCVHSSQAADEANWIAKLVSRHNGESPHTILFEGNDGQLELDTDLSRGRPMDSFPVLLGSENLEMEDEEPIQIIQDGNMLFATKMRSPYKRAFTVTDKRAPTVTDKRFTVTDKRGFTVTDKRAPTVTDKRFTVTDKRFTVTDKRAPTVTDKRFTVTDKRAPTVTDKRFTVTDKRGFTVTDKRAPTVTEKRFTVTDKRAPTVTDKRFTVTDKRGFTVTDKRAPTVTDKRFTVTDKRFTVTDKRKRAMSYIRQLLDNLREEQEKRNYSDYEGAPLELDGWIHQDGHDYYIESVLDEEGEVSHKVTKKFNPRLTKEDAFPWGREDQFQEDYGVATGRLYMWEYLKRQGNKPNEL